MSASIRRKRQQGLSVVELMTALLIGSFLLAGVASVYLSNKATYNARDAMAALQENGRTAIGQLHAGIAQAGFPGIDEGQLPLVLSGATASADNADASSGSDRVTVSFRASATTALAGNLTDCLGNNTSATVRNTFFVQNGQLVCDANSAAGTNDVIAVGVDSMQILYGIDTSNDGAANSYVNAADLGGTSNRVTSVQIGLLLNSLQPVKETASAESFMVLDTQVNAPSDRLLRRVFTTTIPLRNRTLL